MIEKIVKGVFFTNTYIISKEDKCILVDPGLGFEGAANEIKSKYQVEAILITHGHIDHIDGIKYFDCPIYIHKDDEECLYNSDLSLYSMMKMKTPFKKGNLNIKIVTKHNVVI